ncbi:MAG: oxidoreductase [Bdellovibrionales bacterium RIFOXYD12_FULL_39_22]|nr:MAG: oxidoreductase [Bdellovibrionales bacterium RIFOXYB1_FULL_39_21]OFZ44221.1 MAG: oxidoreductase [Bdellovibrionales bacterium RIFOXYC12_FULL_39_17]OFZ46763.1 MAG: oxidoreductase [Bdellovibrionales bacterium RIFOXYC1_FULL_39_130]OFZ75960.1 MAG: oxidoreductase [Bdellovibrionales bacterium RIFOXYD1_FULL_39_84]OFZ95442.1 MAG: oxidoreductase [Bdellovibrionales bacterium RIFOXYD12_FULL_39_22]HLE09825.1 F420-nonreducing hydrogenase [Bacteriovoracaceae bacterium]
MSKPKVTFYWCASCGGCEETVVDLAEGVLDVVAAVDIVLWPVALDFKYKDIEAMADKSIAVSFINGAVRTSEQEHICKLLRQKSQLVVSFGSCAGSGGIPALANLTNKQDIFTTVYLDNPSLDNKEKKVPKELSREGKYDLTLPSFYDTVYKLDDIIEVDYYLPGCPPTPELIAQAVGAILKNQLPPKGTILSPNKALCSSCKLNDSKPEDIAIKEIKRVIDIKLDPSKCYLAQGVVCMGPATRDGCGVSCINGNMPCTGCFGPTDSVKDQGAEMISALGGIIDADSSEQLNKCFARLPDPAGTFYRYGMSASLLGSKNKKE